MLYLNVQKVVSDKILNVLGKGSHQSLEAVWLQGIIHFQHASK